MARVPGIGWALSLSLIGQVSCFHLVGPPLSRTDGSRGDKVEAIGTKFAVSTLRTSSAGRVRAGRLRHVRAAANTVRPDSGESGHGKVGGGDSNNHGEGRGQEAEKSAAAAAAESHLLTDYFVRWGFVYCCTAVFIIVFSSCLPRCSTWGNCVARIPVCSPR